MVCTRWSSPAQGQGFTRKHIYPHALSLILCYLWDLLCVEVELKQHGLAIVLTLRNHAFIHSASEMGVRFYDIEKKFYARHAMWESDFRVQIQH